MSEPLFEMVDTALTPAVAPVLVPTARYTSEAFAAREADELWPRVWQIACTSEHVANPGDAYEFRCGALSVIVVRHTDGSLRAFQNACRHRGNAICQGSASGLTELRCPFHRWAWDLEGSLREVPDKKGFGAMRNEDFPLIPVQVGQWGPLVFVNLDLDAAPLEEWLDGIPADSEWAALDEFRCDIATVTDVPANWKVVAEGFSETYHIQGIHREMLGSIDDVHAAQKLWERHGVSYQRYAVPSPRLRDVDEQAVWDSFVVTQGARMGPEYGAAGTPMPERREGEDVRELIARLIREFQATRGIDLSGYDADGLLRLSQYNLFPNVTVLVWGDMVNVLIARPGPSVHEAEFVMYLLHRAPADAPRTQLTEFRIPNDVDMGMVMTQDIGLMLTAQRGLRQPGLTHLAVGNEECRIINLHHNLERQLGIEPTEMLPIGSGGTNA